MVVWKKYSPKAYSQELLTAFLSKKIDSPPVKRMLFFNCKYQEMYILVEQV